MPKLKEGAEGAAGGAGAPNPNEGAEVGGAAGAEEGCPKEKSEEAGFSCV